MESEYLTESVAHIYFWQLIKALQYLNSLGYMHRDIKPENLAFISKKSNQLKLLDFGSIEKYIPDPGVNYMTSPAKSSVYLSLRAAVLCAT